MQGDRNYSFPVRFMPQSSFLSRLMRPVRTLLGLLLRRPLVGTSVIPLLADGRMVLILRRDDDSWGLPGGLIDWGEDIISSARREMREETGLTIAHIERLVGVYSQPKRDPRFHAICVTIAAQVEGTFEIGDPDEVLEVKAFRIDELPYEQLAHDHTRQIEDYFAGKTALY